MKAKVVGVSEKTGNYQGYDYHNVNIHCLVDSDDCYGQSAVQVKIKFGNVSSVFGKPMSADDWQKLVGKDCNFYYNRFGQVESCQIIQK